MAKSAPEQNIDHIRHSLAHLLAMAVLKKFPKAQLGIGPTIENGFYYDFKIPRPLSHDDLPELEKKQYQIIEKKLDITLEDISQAMNIISKLEPRPGRIRWLG